MSALAFPQAVELPKIGQVGAFPTPEELRHLTGYKRAADQIRWLTVNGIEHFVNALRHPVVPRDAFTKEPLARFTLGAVR